MRGPLTILFDLRTPSGSAARLPFGGLALPALLALLAAGGGCTKENAAFCCLDAADCAKFSIADTERPCADGLACVDNACVVPSCASAGCSIGAPVCDTTTDTCVGCAGPTDCTRFPGTEVCEMTSGSCVACVIDADCLGATTPICDANVCRGCTLDTECASGACADDGSCVPEDNVVYLDPQGTDAVPCSRAAPCKELYFATQQITTTRTHLVFATGNYTLPEAPHYLGPSGASRLWIHGHGAVLTGGSTDGFLIVGGPTTLRDLELIAPSVGDSQPLHVSASAVLKRVRLRGAHNGLSVSGQLDAMDLDIEAAVAGLINNGSVVLDRARIKGGQTALRSNQGNLDITNMVAFGSSGTAIELQSAVGTIASSTIYSRADVDPPGLSCIAAGVTLRSSIVWTPTTVARVGVYGSCTFATSIVGPVGVVGASNNDPLFVNPAAGDFHISGGSPARDAADSGPSTDLEGDPRPRGARFDLGADEAP